MPTHEELRCGDVSLTVQGGAVASITSLSSGDGELLVGPEALPSAYRVHDRAAGISLLHPWANRLEADRFSCGGRSVVVGSSPSVTRDDAGRAIHGLAVEGTFAVERVSSTCARVRGAWDGTHPAFPFPHALVAQVTVRASGVDVVTTLTASGDAPVPVAFGWHPYFRLPGADRRAWEVAAPGIPRAPLGSRTFDDPVPGGPMSLSGAGRSISVTPDAAAYPAGQLFAPPDRDVVSLEPMTAPADALRTGEGLRFVEPGGTFTAAFAIELR